jgi:hypothetical protein
MTGAKLQLYSLGKENTYLTKNPQISFFKQVYMKYSNFSMQSIDLQFEFIGDLSFDNTTKIKLKLDKNGDLIHKLFLELNLPGIRANTDKKHLHWADNISDIIVKNARVLIGGNIIEEYDSEYMYIYNNLSNTTDQKSKLDDLLCKSQLKYDSRKYINEDIESMPSTLPQKIKIPLPFWFHRHIGASLPISSLLYHDAIVELELRPLKELLNYHYHFDITTTNPTKTINRTQIKSISGSGITKDNILTYFENNRWNINPILNIEYIFLEGDLKKDFTTNTLQYIVEPITKLTLDNRAGKLDLRDDPTNSMPHHPCKEIFVVPRRTDVKNTNNWVNFTNWDNSENIEKYLHYQTYFYNISRENHENDVNTYPSPIDYLVKFTDSAIVHSVNGADQSILDNDKISDADIDDFLSIWKHRPYKNIPSIDINNYTFFSANIIKNMSIDFDETNRISRKNYQYYNKIQTYMHHKNYLEGICSYSFSLEPDKYNPSGSCNLGNIKNIRFEIELKNPDLYSTENYKYDLFIYMKYYNILQINSGMSDLLFRI